MALGILDQVTRRLGEHWWNVEEKQYVRKFSQLEPTVSATIRLKAAVAVAAVDSSAFDASVTYVAKCRAAGPFGLPKPLKEYR